MQVFAVDPSNPHDASLAREAFRTIFTNYWPQYVDQGLESIDNWLDSIAHQNKLLQAGLQPKGAVPMLILAVDGTRPVGLSYGMVFPDSATMLGVFSAVAPDMQRQGIGRQIFDARLREGRRLANLCGTRTLRALFIETMNPAYAVDKEGRSVAREGMLAADRKKVFNQLGCTDVPLAYSQPFTYLLPGEEMHPHDHDPLTGAFSSYDLMIKRLSDEPIQPIVADYARSLASAMRPCGPVCTDSVQAAARIQRMQILSDLAHQALQERIAAMPLEQIAMPRKPTSQLKGLEGSARRQSSRFALPSVKVDKFTRL